MKHTVMTMAALTVSAGLAMAGEVAPTDVVYDADNAVAMSLSGAPGDMANGRKLMNKGAGNCIACHQVTEMSELLFHGEIGPSLDGVADRYSEAELRGIVSNAKLWFEDTMMPSFYKVDGFVRLGNAYTGKAHEGDVAPLLTGQQIEDVLSYLLTLKDS